MITVYTELRAAVANYMHRADFADDGINAERTVEFVMLAEKRINRMLQKLGGGEIASTVLVANAELLDLPADFNAMRYLAINGSQMEPIKYRTPEVMYSEWSNNSVGKPRMFTIHGKDGTSEALQARFRPIPDGSYNLLAMYYKKIAPLGSGGGSGTNWMLTNNPDVYIAAACLEAAIWIRDQDAIGAFTQSLMRAVEDITESDDERRVANASPRAAPSFKMLKGM